MPSGYYLSMSATQGDPRLTFSCSSDGVPLPEITWERGISLPSGVIPSSDGQLSWNRLLHYADSGQYQCRAGNSEGNSTARI